MSPVVGAGTARDAPVIDSAGRRPGGADRQILGTLMLAFDGREVPDAFTARLRDDPAAGVTLFRYHNVDSEGQVRQLTASLQRAAAGQGSAAADRSAAMAMVWFAVFGMRESAATALRKNGVEPSAELSTMISVICMVNGSSIHRPR